jgi:protein-export membrane protein SecD
MRKFIKLKAFFLAALMTLATLAVLPSVSTIAKFELPTWITDNFTREFKLGLDLQGGLHLEYSVAVDEAVENKLDRVGAELEAAFREKKDVKVSAQRKGLDEVHLYFEKAEDLATATPDVMGIANGILERVEDMAAEPGGPVTVIRMKMPETARTDDTKAIVGQALETVRRRVDAMGVAEPNIYPKNQQIVIELPGLADTGTEVRAAMDDTMTKVVPILNEEGGATQVVQNPVEGDPGAISITIPGAKASEVIEKAFSGKILEGKTIIDQRIGLELEYAADQRDPALAVIRLTEAAKDSVLENSSGFRRLLKVIERAAVLEMHLVDDEAIFGKTGKPYLRALWENGFVEQGMGISVNIEADYGKPEKGGVLVKEPTVYWAKERETLERFFAGLPAEWRLPATHKVAYMKESWVTRRGAEPEELWHTVIIKSRADITGDRIVNATVNPDPQTGIPKVDVKFDRIGATAFGNMSSENVGRKMAIIMDDMVVSDPVFNEPIMGGNVQISLGNTPGESVREQANDLVKVLKSGSLPARLQKEFEIRVGADLGQESVEAGAKAFIVGLGLVILFMAIYYRKSGFIAVFALVMNMIMVLATMALFQATLTLPGIAGIVLTIGMAVDANVIIFERIREYVRDGYTARAAIDAGYDRAFTTILDSQLTTAIAGLVLWQFGSGPIRGFAITLLIGIATSIFTAVFAARVFFDWQANRRGFDRVSI